MNQEKIKAILFDMDGVIVDSEPLHFEAHKKALEHFGIEMTLEDYIKHGVASGDDHIYEKMSEKSGKTIDKKEISAIKKQFYREIFDEKGKLIPGILEALQDFSKGYKLALVSSGTMNAIEYVLEKLNIKNYFSLIVCGEDVERVKPFPDLYLKAIELLNIKRENCIAIEDSATGISAAKEAGLKCIAIPNEFTKNQDLSRADIIMENIKEIDKNILNNL